MMEWKTYHKLTATEIRPYVINEKLPAEVNIADYYLKQGSPKVGDMICRNADNPDDVWLIDKDYFEKHYKKLSDYNDELPHMLHIILQEYKEIKFKDGSNNTVATPGRPSAAHVNQLLFLCDPENQQT